MDASTTAETYTVRTPSVRNAVSHIAAFAVALLFLTAGIWKMTEPFTWARMVEDLRVPYQLSMYATLALAVSETLAGALVLIPKYRRYAPGLDVASSLCGVHAVDVVSGKVMGSLLWPWGNQIFAIDWLPRKTTGGFLATVGKVPDQRNTQRFFYAFSFQQKGSGPSEQ